jgi:hypothetical protein
MFYGRSARRTLALTIALALPSGAAPAGLLALQSQQPPPVPRPFPGASLPPAAPAKPAPQTAPPQTPPADATCATTGAPTEASLMVRVPPTAEYLESYDAGRGQCFYIFGTNDLYADVVQYFRSLQLRGQKEIYREPPMHGFELGKFDDRSMAFPPSVVVKDYTWNNGEGYAFVKGSTQKRFKTIIQIVPPRP